jgi:two-component system response regulator HydG
LRHSETRPTVLRINVGTPLEEVEHRMLRATLQQTDDDKSLAAQLLGISTRTIYRKLAEMGQAEMGKPD